MPSLVEALSRPPPDGALSCAGHGLGAGSGTRPTAGTHSLAAGMTGSWASHLHPAPWAPACPPGTPTGTTYPAWWEPEPGCTESGQPVLPSRLRTPVCLQQKAPASPPPLVLPCDGAARTLTEPPSQSAERLPNGEVRPLGVLSGVHGAGGKWRVLWPPTWCGLDPATLPHPEEKPMQQMSWDIMSKIRSHRAHPAVRGRPAAAGAPQAPEAVRAPG